MDIDKDPRMKRLAGAVKWYHQTRGEGDTENAAIAQLDLYLAHGFPFGLPTMENPGALSIWMYFKTWTTSN